MFKKELVIVTPWLGSFAGGAESLARGLAREFQRRGVATALLTTCSRSPYDSWWDDYYEPGPGTVDGVSVRRFRTNKVRAPFEEVIRKIQNRETLTLEDTDNFFEYGINSSELCDALGEMVAAECEVLAVPYFHGLTHSVVNNYPGKVSLVPCFHNEPQFYWSATERLLANAKQIFYNSPEEKAMTTERYGRVAGRRVVEGPVVGVGVELSHDPHPAASGPLLPKDYFVYAGRKEGGKNVPLLCDWFGKYANQIGNDTRLVFIGGGEHHLIPRSDRFIDLGFVPEDTKQHVIRNSKAVINLSENESFSIVLMEGWLLGVPAIVSSRSTVMKGHVQRSNGGLYVDDLEEFVVALECLENNESIRTKLAGNGRDYVARNFSFDTVLTRYLESFSNGHLS